MGAAGVFAAFVVAVGLLADFPRRAEAEESPPRAQDGYVGAEACRACHAAEHRRWTTASHALTFLPAGPGNLPKDVLEGRTIHHPPGTTTFHAGDGRYVAETIGPSGERERFSVTHVVGRRRIRMYVTRLEDDRLQVLPFMLEEPTGEWFDYTHLIFGAPGGTVRPDEPPIVEHDDASFWTGPVRSFDARCIRCHVSGHEARHPGLDGRGERSTWRALGVDCESCHGPGKAHVEFRSAPASAGGKDPMLDQASLSRDLQVSVCMRCHVEAEVMDASFHPGEDAFEHVDPTLLDDPERVDPSGRPLELIYDGLPFAMSRCAEASGMTCTQCHDPHGSPHVAQLRLPPDDDRMCTTCHEEVAAEGRAHTRHDPAGAGARCVSCHMHFLSIERGHGVVADHTIGIPRMDAPGDRVATDACTWCHEGRLAAPAGAPRLAREALLDAWSEWWPDVAEPPAWERAIAAGRLGTEDAPLLLERLLDTRSAPRFARATAARLLMRWPEEAAEPLLRASTDEDGLVRRNAVGGLRVVAGERADVAMLRALSDPSAPVRIRAARAALDGWTRLQENRALLDAVLPVLVEDAAAAPDDDQRWFRLGAAREIAGDLAGAVEAYEKQVALDPFAANVREHLASLKERVEKR
jgi:predicted CXXCH cytochrome family protein